MTSTAVATLPSGSDPAQWSSEEKALVEAAGLVAVDARSGEKTAAPRPVVAAFLQHCQRTGLDPFARQIYCLARKSKGEYKWTTQISIDGARLVAERTGKYEGQTTPEFTADGTTWTEVWLSTDLPRAARVGVYRAGFREPLYAVALWEAYAVYQDEWSGGAKTGKQTLSAMWAKMGPLMLAKCAEMLALRKAFPQDLSGLYSTEEMDQAGAPREVVKLAESSSAVAADAGWKQVVDETPAPQQQPIEPPTATRDWVKLSNEAETVAELTAYANEAEALGEIGIVLSPELGAVIDVLRARRAALQNETPKLVDVPTVRPVKRQWAREARSMKTREEVAGLRQEAVAAGALAQIIEELEAIENTLPDAPEVAPVTGGWPVVQIPESDWVENDEGVFVEAPAVLDETIGDGS